MAYTLPPIAVTGEIITAAWGNDVRNALAVLKTGLTSDVGSYRATLNGTAAVDTGIARPALVNANGRDEWGMVNFGDSVGPLRDADRIGRRSSGNLTTIPVTGETRVPVDRGSQNPFWTTGYLYFGSSSAFAGVSIDFVTPTASNNVAVIVEYWNGSSWTTLTASDGTNNGGTFKQDGQITWAAPNDWAQTSVQNGGTRYWVRFKAASGSITQVTWASAQLIGASETDGRSRDAEWPIIRLNDLHDTEICPAVSAGDVLDRTNSLVFADAVANGEDAYLGVLSNGNLAIAVGPAGVHALPFSIKTLNANRLA